MPIEEISDHQFFDMFNLGADAPAAVAEQTTFSRQPQDNNIFEEKTEEVKEEDPKPAEPAAAIEEVDPNKDANIFEGEALPGEDPKKGRKPKYDFSDATGYFEDRIKNGRFVAVEEEVDGEVKPFIPKTPEDFDEFFDINLNHRFQERQKEIEGSWYESKTPAWKAIAQFADKNAPIEEVLSFMQGVQNVNDIASLDETTTQGAEQVYRTWLSRRGETPEAIEEQVELAKTADKLTSMATKYKPILVQQESQRLADMDKKQAEQNQRYDQIIWENEKKAIEAIESPIFGKQKLKEDEKALVYDLIGRPQAEAGGYKIYAELDRLFQNRDFATLRELSLLLAKKDSYLSYASTKTKEDNATGLMRTLKVANSTKPTATTPQEEEVHRPAAVVRQPYSSTNNGFSRPRPS